MRSPKGKGKGKLQPMDDDEEFVLVNGDEEVRHVFGNTDGVTRPHMQYHPARRTQQLEAEAPPPWPQTWLLCEQTHPNTDPQESASDESGTQESDGYMTVAMREDPPSEDELEDIGAQERDVIAFFIAISAFPPKTCRPHPPHPHSVSRHDPLARDGPAARHSGIRSLLPRRPATLAKQPNLFAAQALAPPEHVDCMRTSRSKN
jgi:hypothetical protein